MEWMQRCRDSVTVFAREEREQCLGRLRDKDGCPVLYVQRGCAHAKEAEGEEHHDVHFGQEELQEALARWERFRGVLRALFPEEYPQGTVRSALQDVTEPLLDCAPLLPRGRHLLKRDDELPVAGSIKARGGIYEVLWFAEQVAEREGVELEDLDRLREACSGYRLAVGSTGNLGLSIGLVGAALHFQVDVHMSVDAKEWKKERLRRHGVRVVEHRADYSQAVAQGREQSQGDPKCHFVDDETSPWLFQGYSAAAVELQEQLRDMGVQVDEEHPLHVYLPCGVGGAPGGVAAGLHLLYGKAVHCFWAEPVGACCGLLGLLSAEQEKILSVYDIGQECVDTVADGLACPVISELALRAAGPHLAGSYTVPDQDIVRMQLLAHDKLGLRIEPSCATAFFGSLFQQPHKNATHVYWMTGGSLIPEGPFSEMIEFARRLATPPTTQQ